jgi:2-methylcitrate dehydratase PrpD
MSERTCAPVSDAANAKVSTSTPARPPRALAGSFLPDRLRRQEVLDLARRVRVTEEPEFSAALPRERPTRVTVHWQDGSSSTASVRNARGNPDDALEEDEVERKFHRNTDGVVSAGLAEAVADSMLRSRGGYARSVGALMQDVVGRLCP